MGKRKREEEEFKLWKDFKRMRKKEKKRKHRNSHSPESSHSTSVCHDELISMQDANNEETSTQTEAAKNDECRGTTEVLCSNADLMTEETATVQEDVLDEEVLKILGEGPKDQDLLGPKIQRDVAARWSHILINGLDKDMKQELNKQYLTPSNCLQIEPPLLNLELKAALGDPLWKRDKALEFKQKQTGKALTAIGEALTAILKTEKPESGIIKSISDAGRILCDQHFTESATRRNFILPALSKENKDTLQNTKIDKWLFGESLAETVKMSKAISKSGLELKNHSVKPNKPKPIQAPGRPTNHLNLRGPPPPFQRKAAPVQYSVAGGQKQQRQRKTTYNRPPPPRNCRIPQRKY